MTNDIHGIGQVAPSVNNGSSESAALPVLEDLGPVKGCRVLVRADLNVPLRSLSDERVQVADDFRLRASLPTLNWLVKQGAMVTVCSHLGRPNGKIDPRYSMEPVRQAMGKLAPAVTVMENLRFDPGEEANDPVFVRKLVRGFDFYVNDAFGASHRSHASIVGPPALLPSAAGRLLAREAQAISRVLDDPRRPLCSVIGGAKVADKIGMLRSLADRSDSLLIGGAMSYTFLAALGYATGSSPVEQDFLDDAQRLMASHSNIELPIDLLGLSPDGRLGIDEAPAGEVQTFERDLPPGWTGLDIGPATVARYTSVIAGAGTVLWNGPVGVFEDSRFLSGTAAVARAIAQSSAYSVVGGGETVAAVHEFGCEDRIDHVSSGGGATLELLEKGDLPGLAALRLSCLRTARGRSSAQS